MDAEGEESGVPQGALRNSIGVHDLAPALRAAASLAAEAVGGGAAMLFVSDPSAELADACPQLRAAAGFARPQAARDAAGSVIASVHSVIEKRKAETAPALGDLAERCDGGLWVHPLIYGTRVHGALAITYPATPDASQLRAIESIVSGAALRLDHAALAQQLADIHQDRIDPATPGEENGDEILRLSETLFAQDIELLRSNEKLSKIEKLKNDFIEKMSCELRTPLNSIIESIISVLTGEHETLSETSKQGLRRALDDGTAFLRTLQNILDLWRIKQGELPVEFQELNFREIVDEAVFSIQDALSGKPLTLEKRLEEPFPKLRSDLAKVNQILFLLLDNAVKFTNEGTIEIEARVDGEHLSFFVRDTGVGICPDDQNFIFDEFFQVDEPTSKHDAGAGLGLALVRDLVVLLGGEVAVSSDAGRGTTVTVRIPVQVV
jgi:signal transduction histidine kinase